MDILELIKSNWSFIANMLAILWLIDKGVKFTPSEKDDFTFDTIIIPLAKEIISIFKSEKKNK
jgi:hypothetical protein